MKLEHLKLPWELRPRETTFFKNYSIHNSEGDYVMDDEDYENLAPERHEADYILQAANNFPEAVRLLKELLKEISYGDIIEEVNQFLTKLEEDEKDSK